MCYSWHEDVEKSVQNEEAREDRRETVPEWRPEKRVRSEHVRFWSARADRRTTEEATTDRVFEKV
jgi:hypothetical protein